MFHFKAKQTIIIISILFIMFLAACQAGEVETQSVDENTAVTEQVVETEIPQVIVTDTPAEVVPTEQPTQVPTQMPTSLPTIPVAVTDQQTSQPDAQLTSTPMATIGGQPTSLPGAPATPTAIASVAAQAQPTKVAVINASTVATGVLSGYCMPEHSGSLIGSPTPSASMPFNGKAITVVDGVTQIPSPMESCTFVFDFGTPLSSGAKLEVYDVGQNSPWFTKSLSTAPGNQNLSLVVVTHHYIINPPFWEIPYVFRVVDSSGTEKWSEQVLVKKWVPEKCWNGEYPDPVSLECPINDG